MSEQKMKYLTFSYDDGVKQDLRLIELFNKYNMKATFNLNSDCFGKYSEWNIDSKVIPRPRVELKDVKHIYDGHEIAAHTLTHPLLPLMEDEKEIIREVEEDRLNLSEIAGYEVVGFAYPGGGVNFDERVAEIIKNNTGVKYARTTISSDDFNPQKDLYVFRPSVYHHRDFDRMIEMGKQFLDMKTETAQIFYVWGHAYEFDLRDDWKRFEGFLEMMSGRNDICYCTNKEALLNLS